METKHTKGPWQYSTTGDVMKDKYSQPFGIIEYGKPNLIAGCFGDVKGGEETAKANARLIAAAPELLSLVREYQFVMGNTGNSIMSDMAKSLWDRANELITKATGL